MLSIPVGEYNDVGFANLDEAVELARTQGIVNAQGAVSADLLWPLYSLGTMIGMGLASEIPGIGSGSQNGGVSVRTVNALSTPPLLHDLLKGVEGQVVAAAGTNLPQWHPTRSPAGVRMVAMINDSVFRNHSDDYEGLVVSLQLAIDGVKTMRAQIDNEWHQTQVKTGDITLFGCDTFSDRSRALHGFNFTGAFAVAFTLGQDPFYTISGNHPLLDENPQYLSNL